MLDLFLDLNIPVSPARQFVKLALSIAAVRGGSVYDCTYVALAAISQQPLLTADERLANMMAAYCAVRWVGTL